MCIYIYIYIYTHTHTYIHMCVHMYISGGEVQLGGLRAGRFIGLLLCVFYFYWFIGILVDWFIGLLVYCCIGFSLCVYVFMRLVLLSVCVCVMCVMCLLCACYVLVMCIGGLQRARQLMITSSILIDNNTASKTNGNDNGSNNTPTNTNLLLILITRVERFSSAASEAGRLCHITPYKPTT